VNINAHGWQLVIGDPMAVISMADSCWAAHLTYHDLRLVVGSRLGRHLTSYSDLCNTLAMLYTSGNISFTKSVDAELDIVEQISKCISVIIDQIPCDGISTRLPRRAPEHSAIR